MVELNDEEYKAIASLQRLAKRWPKTLWLFSASGELCVMKNAADGSAAYTDRKGVDPDYYTGETIDISNDGGDW